jgi:hypothetical protein
MWIPNTLALMAVQRQTAASRSRKAMNQGTTRGFGWCTDNYICHITQPSAQTPNFNLFLGHVAAVEVTNVKRTRLSKRRKTLDDIVFDAIS